jgi:predicted phosphatase
MKINIDDNTIIVFDLDRTIWDCKDKFNNNIWAKQLIPPYKKINKNTIVDDCFSVCTLNNGFNEFIEKIKNNKVVFLSNGGILDVEKDNQPSIKFLKMFDIYKYFDQESVLTYKTFEKERYFNVNKKYLFFDDDDKHLLNVSKNTNVICIDRKTMGEWCNTLIQK